MQQEEAQEALFTVLVRRRASGPAATEAEVEASAYALSAASILAQHDLDTAR